MQCECMIRKDLRSHSSNLASLSKTDEDLQLSKPLDKNWPGSKYDFDHLFSTLNNYVGDVCSQLFINQLTKSILQGLLWKFPSFVPVNL